jgi:Mce-associated membrane protein
VPHQPNPHQNAAARSGRQSSRQARRPKVAGLRLRPESSAAEHVALERTKDVSVTAPDVEDTHVPAVEDAHVPTAEDAHVPTADEVDAALTDAAEVRESGEMPAAVEVPSAEKAAAEGAEARRAAVRRGPTRFFGAYTVPVALVLLTAVFAGLAVWFGSQAEQLRSGGAAQNRALVDSATTSEVVGQVTTAVQTVFSYDFNNMDKTATAAKDMLVGNATKQYQQLYDQVRVQAPQQKLVVTMTVKSVGVKLLQGDKADVLVFADQTVLHTDTNQSQVGAAQFTVTVQRANGHWRLADFTLR